MSDRPPSDDDAREPNDEPHAVDGDDSPRPGPDASGHDDVNGPDPDAGGQGDGADDTVDLLGRPVRRRTLRVAVAVLAVLSLLYSLLIAGQILLWVSLIAPFVFLYLLWRFVRAHERIAAAQERRAAVAEE